MDGLLPLLISAVLDFVLAGHENNVQNLPYRGESRGEEEGGIGLVPIIGVIVLTLVTIGLLVSTSRGEREPGERSWLQGVNAKTAAPVMLILAIIAVPLLVWSGSSGGEEKKLFVERGTNRDGVPEFLFSLGDEELNTLAMTNGKRSVRLQCLGRGGQIVLETKRKWPFVLFEEGYEYPHVHQKASTEQLQLAESCRLRGTRVHLEADVKGGRLAG